MVQESSETRTTSSVQKEKLVKIDGRGHIWSVAFLVDGKHVVSGDTEGKVRRWRVKDGVEVGSPMDAGDTVCNIAVSQDGAWIVGGTSHGQVVVWDASTGETALAFKAHGNWVNAVDVSPDSTTFATGSDDCTACVWSLSTGNRLLGPLQYDHDVVGVKFSPDGRLIATATEDHNSVRIYDCQAGSLLVDFPVVVADSTSNQTLVWSGDSKRLFALARDSTINCLDVCSGSTLSRWRIHSHYLPASIAMARNGTFIAAAADTSVSFWDTVTHKQIGTVIRHADVVASMAISANYDIVASAGKTISRLRLHDILPSFYFMDRSERNIRHRNYCVEADLGEAFKLQDKCPEREMEGLEQEMSRISGENARFEDTVQSLLADIRDLHVRQETSDERIAHLEALVDGRLPQLDKLQSSSEGTLVE